jgi:hypothetical protein
VLFCERLLMGSGVMDPGLGSGAEALR